MRPAVLPLTIMSAVPLVTGGALHLRDWVRTYRAIPWEVPGAWVVRVGFPVNAAVSAVLAGLLLAAAAGRWSWLRFAVAGAIAFQVSSIVALVLSRQGSFLGWAEPVWTVESRQILAVELLTVLALAAAAVATLGPRVRLSNARA
jgi:hypothetical protein